MRGTVFRHKVVRELRLQQTMPAFFFASLLMCQKGVSRCQGLLTSTQRKTLTPGNRTTLMCQTGQGGGYDFQVSHLSNSQKSTGMTPGNRTPSGLPLCGDRNDLSDIFVGSRLPKLSQFAIKACSLVRYCHNLRGGSQILTSLYPYESVSDFLTSEQS